MMACGNCGFDDASIQGFCKQCGASASRFIALAAAARQGGDAKQAPGDSPAERREAQRPNTTGLEKGRE